LPQQFLKRRAAAEGGEILALPEFLEAGGVEVPALLRDLEEGDCSIGVAFDEAIALCCAEPTILEDRACSHGVSCGRPVGIDLAVGAAGRGNLDPQRTGKVFNVLGDVFPANQLERMLREMYARNLTEDVIKSRIVEEVDRDRFRRITNSTLEGLAKRELNLAAIVGRSAEARERRMCLVKCPLVANQVSRPGQIGC
jgi:hypothetical protein